MSIEVKVVIVLKGERGSIGVQSPEADPVLVTFQGGLDIALQMVPDLVEAAHQQWAENRRYPESKRPEPPPSTPTSTPPCTTTPRRTTHTPQPAGQARMF